MPYKSKAQQRLFHSNPKLKKVARKWDKETKETKGGFKKLKNYAPSSKVPKKAQRSGKPNPKAPKKPYTPSKKKKGRKKK